MRAAPASSHHSHELPYLLLSGFFAGLAVATRLTNALAIVAPGLWLLWICWRTLRISGSLRKPFTYVLAWGVPIVAWLVLIAGYNWLRFRDVAETGYRDEVREFDTPVLTGLYGLLLSPGRGLVWYDPPLVLALVGVVWFARRRPDLALVIAGIAAPTVVIYSLFHPWYGGGSWGTRFLVPLLPLLLLPAGELVERAWGGLRWARGAVIGLALAGLFVTALGILVPFDRYVTEFTVSPERQEETFWEIEDSPLVVHAQRLDDTFTEPDIAAVRYGSRRLGVISAVTAVGGIVTLAGVVGLVRRGAPTAA